MFLPYRALTGPKPPSRKDPGMTNEAEEATETTSAPKRRQERLRTLAVCLGSMTSIPWWPTLSSLSRSYQSGTFPLPADHATLLVFAASVLFALGAFLRPGNPHKNAQAGWHFALAATAATLTLYGIALIPSTVSDMLKIAGSAFAGLSSACLAVVWGEKAIAPTPAAAILRIAAPLATTALCVYLAHFLGEQAILVAAGTCSAASLAIARGLPDLPLKPRVDLPPQINRLFITSRTRLRSRLFIAGLFVGFSFSIMLYRFISASYERLSDTVFLSGCGGVVALLLLVAVSAISCHEIDSVLVFRLSMITAVPSFFPMDPGSQFSIVFAVVFSLLSAFVFMGSFALMAANASNCIDFGSRRTELIGWTGTASGAMLGLIGGPLSNTVGSELISTHTTIGISFLGLLSMILTFMATSVLISRNALRDLQFLSVGKLPLSYTLYEAQGAMPDEKASLVACCKELSLSGGLTQRESEVLVILARGNSLSKVQEELFISQGTAITHRNSIYRKLGVHSRQELLDRIDGLRNV